MKKAYFDVSITDFNTSAADMARLLPAGTIPSSVSIPSQLIWGRLWAVWKWFPVPEVNLRSTYSAADPDSLLEKR